MSVYVYTRVPNCETVSHTSSLLESGIHTHTRILKLFIKQLLAYVGLSGDD
jgi:hypothetical protein